MRFETNAICCEGMCTALSREDLVLRRDGPALPEVDAPALCFCPFCGAQYLPPETGAAWGWRLVRLVADAVPVTVVGPREYNTPY